MSTELTLLTRVAYRGQEVAGARLQGLLALLASDLRAGCSVSRLVDGLWPDEPPQHPAKAVQILVSRARAQLGADLIARTATGYRLCLREDQVDACAVLLDASASLRYLRGGETAAALARADAALASWAGEPDGDDGTDPVGVLRTERAGTYRSLRRTRALALARLGRYAEATGPLTDLARLEPRDEEVQHELLRCEAATAGPAAALERYEGYRRSVRDELGTDPGPALQALHGQLLRGEPAVAARHDVPHEPNPLLGRDGDIAAVSRLLHESRVTTIIGPGGLGKTRLAQAVGRRAGQPTVHFVPLAGVRADSDVAPEVATVLGVGGEPRAPVRPHPGASGPHSDVNTIVAALGSGPVLLVLDNCEQIVDGVAELVHALVSKTEELRVLATSRRPLGLTSESVYPLPELDLPACVELFGQRARAARPGVELPPATVEELCRHLDGLPLAVELAAARVRAMSVAEIAQRLADRFTLLRGGPRDAPRRHHTLHDVVDWSWGLLAPDGQKAMRILSVFPGGFTAEAAGRLLAGTDPVPVLEHLVDQSLLKVVDTPAGTRFRMLETVREFSAARREEAGETDRALDAFLGWARGFGMAYGEAVLGVDTYAVAQRVRAEQDNLVLAMRLALARDDGATVAAAGTPLGLLWAIDANHDRVITLIEETAGILSHFRPAPEYVGVTRALATVCVAYTFMLRGPRPVRSLLVLRRLPPPPPDTLAGATAIVLRAAPEIGTDPAVLFALCDSDEPLVAAVANVTASYFWESRNDPERALAAARRMLDGVARDPGLWLRVMAHSRVGELCMHLGRSEEARHHLAAAVRLTEASGSWTNVNQLRWGLIMISLHLGDIDEAEHWLAAVERDSVDVGYPVNSFESSVRAEIRLSRGDIPTGLRLWRRAVEQAEESRTAFYHSDSTGLEPWALELRCVAVVAHVRHGLPDQVAELIASLPGALRAMLTHPSNHPPSYTMERPLCGTLLVAIAMVELDRTRRTGDQAGRTRAARMIAMAERLRYLRGFQPTMAPGPIREAAEQADRAAYDEAVSSYAALGEEDLRPAALGILDEPDYLTGSRL